MTAIERAERIRVATGEELEQFRSTLEGAGLTWSEPELVVSKGAGSEYTAELKVLFYQGDDITDVFEFFVCKDGVLTISEAEVRRWIVDNVPDVVRRRMRR